MKTVVASKENRDHIVAPSQSGKCSNNRIQTSPDISKSKGIKGLQVITVSLLTIPLPFIADSNLCFHVSMYTELLIKGVQRLEMILKFF